MEASPYRFFREQAGPFSLVRVPGPSVGGSAPVDHVRGRRLFSHSWTWSFEENSDLNIPTGAV